MSNELRSTAVFTAMELKRLLRTSQLWTHVLGPFLGLPAILLVGTIQAVSMPTVLKWFNPPVRVAIDSHAPAVLELETAFEDEGMEVLLTTDAGAAFEREEVDIALVDWLEGDGLGTRVDESLGPFRYPLSRPNPLTATAWRWQTTVIAHDADDQQEVSEILEAAGDQWLNTQLEVRGVDPEPVRRPWTVQTYRPHNTSERKEKDVFEKSYLTLMGVFSAIAIFQLLGVLPLSDRRDGISETWRVIAVSPFAVVCGRMLAAVILTSLLLFASIAVPFAGLSPPEVVNPMTVYGHPITCCLVMASTTAPLGLYASSVNLANNLIFLSWLAGGAILYGLSQLSPGLALLCGITLFSVVAYVLARAGALDRPLAAEAEA